MTASRVLWLSLALLRVSSAQEQEGSRLPPPVLQWPLHESDDCPLTVGGEIRARYEMYRRDRWGDGAPADHDYLWLRAMPFADLHSRRARAFVQMVSAFELGDEAGRTSIDEDRADFLQAFVDVGGQMAATTVCARVGRQVLAYGSERLISTRYGPNVMRTFDVARLIVDGDDWRVDLFYGRPVSPELGAFDDVGDPRATVWAAYASKDLDLGARSGLDLYYIGQRKDRVVLDQGAAGTTRHTVGSRCFGEVGGWEWNYELFGQFGEFGGSSIRAWSLATDNAYTFAGVPTMPRLGVRADVISGDRDRDDGRLQTFDPLYPRGKYFGESGLIGPANLVDLHPFCVLQLGGGWSTEVAAVLYWRQSVADGIYDNGGSVLRSAGDSGSRHIGTQYDLSLSYEPGTALSSSLTWSTFVAGSFLRDTGPHAQVHFVGLEFCYDF